MAGIGGSPTSSSGGITALTGDVTASGSGSQAATIANDAVTYAKIQNVSATDRVLGRSAAGAGDVQEIVCTAAGRALLDDVSAAAQRATLGLGCSVLGTQFDTVSLTPADSGLSVALVAGNTYVFEVRVGQSIDATGAAAISLVFSGTSSAILLTSAYYDSNGTGTVQAIATGNNLAAGDRNFAPGVDVGTSTYVYFGTIIVSGSGTLSVQYAQRFASASPSSVLVGSSISTQIV